MGRILVMGLSNEMRRVEDKEEDLIFLVCLKDSNLRYLCYVCVLDI